MKRIDWIDTVKGVGILLVVGGHMPKGTDLNNWIHWSIYSFHMPLFFLLSGYTFTHRGMNWGILRSRVTRLLVPYLAYGLVFDVLLWSPLLKGVVGYHDPLKQMVINLAYSGTHLFGIFNTFWFLPNLLLVFLLVSLLPDFGKKSWMIVVAGLAIATVIRLVEGPVGGPWTIAVLPFSAAAFACGYWLKGRSIAGREIAIAAGFVVANGIVAIGGWKVGAIPAGIDMKIGETGIPVLSFGAAVGASVLLMQAGPKLDAHLGRFLRPCGKHSMEIMLLHCLVMLILIARWPDVPIAVLYPVSALAPLGMALAWSGVRSRLEVKQPA